MLDNHNSSSLIRLRTALAAIVIGIALGVLAFGAGAEREIPADPVRLGISAVAPLTVARVDGPLASTGIVISQVYGGGGNSGATFKNDFIELIQSGRGAGRRDRMVSPNMLRRPVRRGKRQISSAPQFNQVSTT